MRYVFSGHLAKHPDAHYFCKVRSRRVSVAAACTRVQSNPGNIFGER